MLWIIAPCISSIFVPFTGASQTQDETILFNCVLFWSYCLVILLQHEGESKTLKKEQASCHVGSYCRSPWASRSMSGPSPAMPRFPMTPDVLKIKNSFSGLCISVTKILTRIWQQPKTATEICGKRFSLIQKSSFLIYIKVPLHSEITDYFSILSTIPYSG